MPLPKRVISPVFVSRDTLPEHLQLTNDLEGVTNGSLANIIRQLSSLSRHAEDLFGELYKETENLQIRSSSLQARIDRLAVKTTQLDSTVEEVSLQDIHLRKAFRSNLVFDQQVVSKATIPSAMADTYLQCDKPPPLDKLNVYRDDGKDGLKFYTDPNYFFELWRQEMLKDTERMIVDKSRNKPHRGRDGGNGRKPKTKKITNTRDQILFDKAVMNGEVSLSNQHHHNQLQNQHKMQMGHNPTYDVGQGLTDPNSVPQPPRPDSIGFNKTNYTNYSVANEAIYDRNVRSPPNTYNNSPIHSPPPPHGSSAPRARLPSGQVGMGPMGRESLPPPPPPPIEDYPNERVAHPPIPVYHPPAAASNPVAPVPPPPPPPPMMMMMTNRIDMSRESSTEPELPLPPPPPVPDMPPPEDRSGPPPPPPPPMPIVANGMSNASSKRSPGQGLDEPSQSAPVIIQAKSQPRIPLPAQDGRSDLLQSIREGISLRKVEYREVEKNRVEGLHDVASILARRVAMEFSDSDSGSESESASDWDDETSA